MFSRLKALSPKSIRERLSPRRGRKATEIDTEGKGASSSSSSRGPATVDYNSDDDNDHEKERRRGGPSTVDFDSDDGEDVAARFRRADSGRKLFHKAISSDTDDATKEDEDEANNNNDGSTPADAAERKRKKKKSRFAMGELNLREINLSSERKDAERMQDGPDMSLNATTFRFRKELEITKDGFRRGAIDEKICKDDFVVVKELGRGAGGVVFKAVHIDSLRVVAIKYVRATDAVKRGQIWHELETLTDNFESLSDRLVPLSTCSDEEVRRWLYTVHFGPYSKQSRYIAAMSDVRGLGARLEACKTRKDLAPFVASSLHQKLLLHAVAAAKARGGIRVPAKCPYIIRFHGAFLDPDKKSTVCVVLEYMDGGDLQQFIDGGVRCRETLIASIAFRMLKGLDFLHAQHQIHRDIKPANALVTKRGDVKVSDYGIAKRGAATSSEFQTFTGTTVYMSPERLDGKPYNFTADVWSLGITLMALYMSRIPFSDRAKASFFNLRNEIFTRKLPRLEGASEAFQDFVDRCTHIDKTKRATVRELLKHTFIASHVDEIYDTRNYKKWIKDRLEATKLESTKSLNASSLLAETERRRGQAITEMTTIAKKIVAAVAALARVICADFEESDGENPVARKAMRKFGKVMRRSKLFAVASN
eukprot:g2937.t1